MREEQKPKDKELISIIIPVYNAEKYLDRCLQSILAQTYTYYEVLLINDGSTDRSQAICEKYAQEDKRIHVIQKVNSGVAETRNVGIQMAKGKYISFVDSDDYIKLNMLEKMIIRAKRNNSDIVMCKYFLDNDGEIHKVLMDYEKVYDGCLSIKEGLLKLYYGKYQNGLYSLCNKLIKSSVYIENDILFDMSLKRGEDAWFIFQCLKHCKRVDFISEAFYYYYQNSESIMHTLYDDQYEKWLYMRKLLLQENEELKFDVNYSLFYRDFLYKTVIYCRNLIENKQVEKAIQIMQDEFYLYALNYEIKFPLHIRIIHFLIKKGSRKLTVYIYRLWIIRG